MNWTIGQVADALSASFTGGGGRVAGYSIDSRSLSRGEMFFAVRAERDGHDFVAGAFEQGACAAVVALDWPAPPELAGKALLRVADPRQALAGEVSDFENRRQSQQRPRRALDDFADGRRCRGCSG